ncbi:MAG: phosphoserine phosphatase RsbU/P [bacterium]|jgi:PAS domain S-box-containing protein
MAPPAASSSAPRPEYTLVQVLAEAGTLEEAARRLLELIADAFGWSVGELWLVDEADGLLRWRESWCRPDPAFEEFTRVNRRLTFARGVGLPGRVWETGRPDWYADLADAADFPRRELAARADLNAAVLLPVVGPNGVLGVMEFFSRALREPDPAQLDLMRTVGRQIGQYVARVRAEERLAATEELSHAVVAAALDCVITMDHEGRVVDFNPAAEETFGYAREDVVGRELAELIIPPDLRDAHRQALRRFTETEHPTILGRRIELAGMRADGSILPVELTVTRIGHRSPPLFAGFVRDITERRRTRDELARLLEREQQARVAAEEAERATRRVAVALQRSLLPPVLPEIRGIDLGAVYRSGGEGSAVGGDFYDVFDLGRGRWGIAIGDVRGKGADAAALTALLRYSIRTAAVREERPSTVLRLVNEALLRTEPGDDFCTAVYACLDVSGDAPTLELAVGGHPPPLLLRPGSGVTAVGLRGTLLGAIDEPTLHDAGFKLAPGDALLLYTDGVTESRTPGGLFGIDRLATLLESCAGLDAAGIAHRIESAVVDAPGHVAIDDVALLVVRAEHEARDPR